MNGVRLSRESGGVLQEIKEPRWLAWFYGKRPGTLVLKKNGWEIGGEYRTYAHLFGVEEHDVWFLPRWFGASKLCLKVRDASSVRCQIHLIRTTECVRLVQAVRKATERFLDRCLENVGSAVSKLTCAAAEIYRADRYVRYSQALRLVRDHGSDQKKMIGVLSSMEKHPLLSLEQKGRLSSIRVSLEAWKSCFDETEAYRSRHNETYIAHFRLVATSPRFE